jgi:hypothetical protein
VSLEPRQKAPRWDALDGEGFRGEVIRLVAETDARWETERSWSVRYSFRNRDFREYPTLGKYLESVLFRWAEVNGVREKPLPDDLWIDTVPWGGAYDPATSLDAMEVVLNAKLSMYGGLRKSSRLIVHYSRAWIYNSPFRSLDLDTFRDVALRVAQALAGRELKFEKVYLLNAVDAPKPEAFEVYPGFAEWK